MPMPRESVWWDICTDLRRAGETIHSRVNAMIESSCERLFSSVGGLGEGRES